MRRHKLVQDILAHANEINANKLTLIFLIASMNDRELTKFHKTFMENEQYDGN